MTVPNDGVAGKMGRTRERGRAVGRFVLPCGLFRDHPAARRDRVQAGRHGDEAERHLPGRAPLGHRGEVDRARLPLRGQRHGALRTTSGPPRTSTATCTTSSTLDPSPANRAAIDRLLGLSTKYKAAAKDLFVAIDREDPTAVQRLDHEVIDPIFGVLEYMIHQQARAASARALKHSASLREHEAHATRAIAVAFGGRAGACSPVRAGHRAHPPRRGRAARADRDQRPAHRAAQPPRLPGGPGARAAAGRPERRPAVARAARPRRPEGASTTASATRPATSACRRSPRRSAPHSGRATSRTGSAATSTPSSSPAPAPSGRSSSPSACAGSSP